MDQGRSYEEERERTLKGHNGEGLGPGESRPGVEPRAPVGEPGKSAREVVNERREVAEAAVGGSSVGALTGAGAAVLAIIGLAGGFPFYMMTIATIALGAGLFAEGSSLGAALGTLDRQGVINEGGATTGFALQGLAGAAAVVLGILSLIGVLPAVLVPISIIIMGGALAFGGPARAEMNLNALEWSGASSGMKRAATQAVHTSAGLLTLVGLGSITLGILSLIHVPYAATLVLVGLLALGGTLLLGDSVLLGKVGTSVFRFRRSRKA